MTEWLPIKDAPRDGRPLLLTVETFIPCVGMWLEPTQYQKEHDGFEGCWLSGISSSLGTLLDYQSGNCVYRPTHFQYLPEPPEKE